MLSIISHAPVLFLYTPVYLRSLISFNIFDPKQKMYIHMHKNETKMSGNHFLGENENVQQCTSLAKKSKVIVEYLRLLNTFYALSLYLENEKLFSSLTWTISEYNLHNRYLIMACALPPPKIHIYRYI